MNNLPPQRTPIPRTRGVYSGVITTPQQQIRTFLIRPGPRPEKRHWGNLLGDQANSKTGDEADRLYTLAGEKYAEALKADPEYDEALKNWAITLKDQAKTKSGPEAEQLLAVAEEKFQQAEAMRAKRQSKP